MLSLGADTSVERSWIHMTPDTLSQTELLAVADRLRACVYADPALGERLLEIIEQDAFVAAAAAACDLPADDVRALLGPGHQGLLSQDLPPAGWLPVEVAGGAGLPTRWALFGAGTLTESFYRESATQMMQRPLNRAIFLYTPLAVVMSAPPGPEPDGLIFHMSRCGSTLVAQMLAAAPANTVVSEAQPIDAAVMLGRHAGDGGALLRAMVAVFSRRRRADEARFFVKLDCWHTLAAPLFREAFPNTPWIFQYRDPVEVLVSQSRATGSQMIPTFVPLSFYGLTETGADWGPDYHARVLARICEGALGAFPEGGGLLIDYGQLPNAVFTKILPHFAVTPDADERALMAAAAQKDAKAPWSAFTADSQTKRAAASEAIREAAATHLAEAHARLEAVRLAT